MDFHRSGALLQMKTEDLEPVSFLLPLFQVVPQFVADPILADGFDCKLIAGHSVASMADV